MSWSRIERILSGKQTAHETSLTTKSGAQESVQPHAQFATLQPHPAPAPAPAAGADLHCRSSYSFLHGASDPVDLVAEAGRLGLKTLGITDRDGFYGVARFAEAAAEADLNTVIGAELTLEAGVLTVLARGAAGYKRLSHVICQAHMAVEEKGVVRYPSLAELGQLAAGQWQILADVQWIDQLPALVAAFGAQHVAVELVADPSPAAVEDHWRLAAAAQRLGLRVTVTSCATAATPAYARLAGAKHALAARDSLDDHQPELPALGGRWLRSWQELQSYFSFVPQALQDTQAIAEECAFTLDLIAPELPRWKTPAGHTESTWLAHLARQGARRRYGPAPDIAAHGVVNKVAYDDESTTNPNSAAATAARGWQQLERELEVINALGFPGYFLIVHDICDFCRRSNILAQGRGSAANSVVCYALGITNVEPIAAGLLFERFLSPERDGPPDIDVDIESGRREEVIQYIYEKYGRDNAAQVANVITYRTRGALRDAARALGHDPGVVDAWVNGRSEPPEMVAGVAAQLKGQPRHLGIHSGGMVICDRPIADVVPTEWARKEKRSVVQWDKDDCAAAGLVKFDLLGLGMLEAIHHCLDLVEKHRGKKIELWEIDIAEPEVYAMLARGDAVGVFQVESRAQMATLPRLRPRKFFDLVVQVALIRPGPIQGGSVHPFIRRRNGEEAVTFDHPVLEKSLAKTLGIPLFQEQLMQIAVDAAGFTGTEADSLRRAMDSKRSPERMAALRSRFFAGLQETNGITGEVAEKLWMKIVAFAAYGFPESHAQSFASLVYFSAWFKYHYPAEFCVALLRAQPMGFYSAQSLINDARRHGIGNKGPDIQRSGVEADVEFGSAADANIASATPAIRLGLGTINGLGAKAAERIVTARERQPFSSVADIARRASLNVSQMEALARAGALESLGLSRRQALWAAAVAATEHEGMLPGLTVATAPEALPGMSHLELTAADLLSTGTTPKEYPIAALRTQLDQHGVLAAEDLLHVEDGSRVRVAGIVTHRQRPGTAGGVTFLGLEDETGLMNILCTKPLWNRFRMVATTARALAIRGVAQNASGAVTIVADQLVPLDEFVDQPVVAGRSRDFR